MSFTVVFHEILADLLQLLCVLMVKARDLIVVKLCWALEVYWLLFISELLRQPFTLGQIDCTYLDGLLLSPPRCTLRLTSYLRFMQSVVFECICNFESRLCSETLGACLLLDLWELSFFLLLQYIFEVGSYLARHNLLFELFLPLLLIHLLGDVFFVLSFLPSCSKLFLDHQGVEFVWLEHGEVKKTDCKGAEANAQG